MTSIVKVSSPISSHTVNPMMTGASIVAVKYKKGIIICTDTMISYGGLHHTKNFCRFMPINGDIVLVASGEISDA